MANSNKPVREVMTSFVGLRMPAALEVQEIEGYAMRVRFADGSEGWVKWSGQATIEFEDYCGHGHLTADTAMRCRKVLRRA